MEQDNPPPLPTIRHWWNDQWFWIGAATGVALIWAYKLGRMIGYLEGRDE